IAHRAADLRWEGEAAEVLELDVGVCAVAFDAHHRRVDGVERGTGHQADDAADVFLRDGEEPLDAVHDCSTSRNVLSSSSCRASSAFTCFFAMTAATRTLPPASRMACTAIGRVTPAASSIMRTARLRSFSFVAGMSIMRFEWTRPRRTITPVEIVLSTIFCAVPLFIR